MPALGSSSERKGLLTPDDPANLHEGNTDTVVPRRRQSSDPEA